jgi:MFS family permease
MKTETDTKFRIFLIIIITQTFSILGSQMSSLAVGIKVFNDTNQATPLALVAVFGAVPRLVSANIAGLLADRWNRKKVMILSDVGQAVATLFLLIRDSLKIKHPVAYNPTIGEGEDEE